MWNNLDEIGAVNYLSKPVNLSFKPLDTKDLAYDYLLKRESINAERIHNSKN
jgi:hypothetical protein